MSTQELRPGWRGWLDWGTEICGGIFATIMLLYGVAVLLGLVTLTAHQFEGFVLMGVAILVLRSEP